MKSSTALVVASTFLANAVHGHCSYHHSTEFPLSFLICMIRYLPVLDCQRSPRRGIPEHPTEQQLQFSSHRSFFQRPPLQCGRLEWQWNDDSLGSCRPDCHFHS